jgi:hypothetical protein
MPPQKKEKKEKIKKLLEANYRILSEELKASPRARMSFMKVMTNKGE